MSPEDEFFSLLNIYKNKLKYCKKDYNLPENTQELLDPLIEGALTAVASKVFQLKLEIEQLKAEIRVLKLKDK